MSDETDGSTGERFEALVRLIDRLRSPGGCPWDREQTHESLKGTTIEEAYEVAEAIDDADPAELAGELGDLLLQVVFHSDIASRAGTFTVDDVVRRVSEKMVRRHPHVFADDRADTSEAVLRNWEAIKAAERQAQGKAAPEASMLDSVSARVPGVLEALQMSTKASRVGFDWPDAASVLDKVAEELDELRAAAADAPDHARLADEVGDVLFATINAARLLGVDPEAALKATNRKFRRRFSHVERRLRETGRGPAEASLDEMESHWQEAKRLERDDA